MSNYTLTLSIQNDTQNLLPDLCMIDGKAYCTSLQIAHHFDKRHDNVMRDIEATIAQVLETSNKLKSEGIGNLFKLSEYEFVSGIGAKIKKPMYYLSEQGFTLLAMGYTGAKAMQFKLAYMAAFEKMRDALNMILNTPYVEPETITDAQYQEFRRLIDRIANRALRSSSTANAIWNKLRIEMGVENSHQIPAAKFEQALALLNGMVEHYFDNIYVFMREMEAQFIHEHLCTGVPLTAEIRKQWRLKKGTLLPKPLNWKQIALQVMGDDE